jgi:hypothetical protein
MDIFMLLGIIVRGFRDGGKKKSKECFLGDLIGINDIRKLEKLLK